MLNQPLNNRGDEAAHKALVRSILQTLPNANIEVLFVGKKQDSINQFEVENSRVSYVNICPQKGYFRFLLLCAKLNLFTPLGRFHPTLKKLLIACRNSNMVLCAPGGICMGGFQNWEHISLLSLAKSINIPIAYYGRSIGPFPTVTKQNKLFKKISIELLHYFSFLSLRDNKSMNLADSLNVNYEPTVDSAFLETPQVELPSSVVDAIGCKPYIVFVPNLLIWHYAYKGKVSLNEVLDFYKKILDVIIAKYPEHNVIMLPQTFNYGTYEGDDINFFRDLKQYTRCGKLIIVPDIYSADVQQTIVSKADCMVGARYHSVVFAINQAIPFVALSYEHKISGLLETLDKTNSMVDISTTFDSDENMRHTLNKFEKTLNSACKDVDAQQKAKNIARACFDNFMKLCSGNGQ